MQSSLERFPYEIFSKKFCEIMIHFLRFPLDMMLRFMQNHRFDIKMANGRFIIALRVYFSFSDEKQTSQVGMRRDSREGRERERGKEYETSRQPLKTLSDLFLCQCHSDSLINAPLFHRIVQNVFMIPHSPGKWQLPANKIIQIEFLPRVPGSSI